MKIYPYPRHDPTKVIYEADVKTTKDLIEKAVKEKVDLSEVDLSEVDLSEVDLSEVDLSWANLSGANLSRTNLSGATLFRADLSETNLFEANLSGADFSRSNLLGANLEGNKKYKKITKEEAHSLTKELWIWMKERKLFSKSYWPHWEKYYKIWPDLRGSDCFLCIYYYRCEDCVLVPNCNNYFEVEESAWRKFGNRNSECYDEIINACV
jgi:hypothetical protein